MNSSNRTAVALMSAALAASLALTALTRVGVLAGAA